MDNNAWDLLRANLAEFITDDDRLDQFMDKLTDISDHVFSAMMEQFEMGNDGTWEQFESSPAYKQYMDVVKDYPEVAWIFKWLYQTIGEPNIEYVREVYVGS